MNLTKPLKQKIPIFLVETHPRASVASTIIFRSCRALWAPYGAPNNFPPLRQQRQLERQRKTKERNIYKDLIQREKVHQSAHCCCCLQRKEEVLSENPSRRPLEGRLFLCTHMVCLYDLDLQLLLLDAPFVISFLWISQIESQKKWHFEGLSVENCKCFIFM